MLFTIALTFKTNSHPDAIVESSEQSETRVHRPTPYRIVFVYNEINGFVIVPDLPCLVDENRPNAQYFQSVTTIFYSRREVSLKNSNIITT